MPLLIGESSDPPACGGLVEGRAARASPGSGRRAIVRTKSRADASFDARWNRSGRMRFPVKPRRPCFRGLKLDVATASLLENFIDETERRAWFLFEASRDADKTGH
jgi:hypothetical protein